MLQKLDLLPRAISLNGDPGPTPRTNGSELEMNSPQKDQYSQTSKTEIDPIKRTQRTTPTTLSNLGSRAPRRDSALHAPMFFPYYQKILHNDRTIKDPPFPSCSHLAVKLRSYMDILYLTLRELPTTRSLLEIAEFRAYEPTSR